MVLEHVCEDGSGAFVAAENQHRKDWELRSGTGRYSGITGSGSASFVVDFQANPSEVHIVVETRRGPPPAETQPSDGTGSER